MYYIYKLKIKAIDKHSNASKRKQLAIIIAKHG